MDGIKCIFTIQKSHLNSIRAIDIGYKSYTGETFLGKPLSVSFIREVYRQAPNICCKSKFCFRAVETKMSNYVRIRLSKPAESNIYLYNY